MPNYNDRLFIRQPVDLDNHALRDIKINLIKRVSDVNFFIKGHSLYVQSISVHNTSKKAQSV